MRIILGAFHRCVTWLRHSWLGSHHADSLFATLYHCVTLMRHVFPSHKPTSPPHQTIGQSSHPVTIVTSINFVMPLRHTSCESSIDLATVTSCDGLRRNITFPSSRRLRYVVASRHGRHVVIVTSSSSRRCVTSSFLWSSSRKVDESDWRFLLPDKHVERFLTSPT
jgi:hypothetical protein